MAERADGSIVVDVDLDAEGFKAGSAELQRAVKSFSAQAGKLGPAFQKAMSGNMSSIAAFNGKAQLLESTMAGVRKEMLACADSMAPTAESEALASAAEKAEQEQAALQKAISATEDKLEKAKASAQGYYDEVARAQQSTDEMLKGADTGEQVDRVLEMEKLELEQIEAKYASQLSKVKELTASLEEQKQKQVELTRQAEEFKVQAEQAMKPFSETEFYRQLSSELEKVTPQLKNIKEQAREVENAVRQADLVKSLGIDRAEAEVQRLYDRMEKLSFSGVEKGSKQWKNLFFDIRQSQNALREYQKQLNLLHANGQISDGAYESASERIKAASGSMAGLSKKAKEAASHVNKTASAGGKLASHLKSAMSHVGRMVSGLSRMAFHSRDTAKGASGLLNAVKRLTPALLAAEGVMGLLRKAVSAYMQENQQMANTLNACWSSIGNMLGPIIERLVNLVALASAYFTKFLQLLGFVGKSTGKAISTAGGAASGAVKKLERQLASFDELNILSDNSSDSGGGGAGAGDLGAELQNVELPDWAKLVAQKLKSGDWAGAASTLAGALNDMVASVNWAGLGNKLGYYLNGALTFLAVLFTTFDWLGLGGHLADGVNQILDGVEWENLGTVLAGKFRIILLTVGGFLEKLDWGALAGAFSAVAIGFLNGIANAVSQVNWGKIGSNISLAIQKTDWSGIGTSIGACIRSALNAAGDLIGKIDWGLLGRKAGEMINKIDWPATLSALGTAFGKALNGAIQFIKNLVETVDWKDVGTGLANGLNEFFANFSFSDVTETLSKALMGILDAGIAFMNTFDYDKFGDNVRQGLMDIPWAELLGKVGEFVGQALIHALANQWYSPDNLAAILDIGAQIVEGLFEGIVQALATIGTWINENIFQPIWDGICSAFGIASPSTKMMEIGGYLVAGLLNGITEAWHGITEFFGKALSSIGQAISGAWSNVTRWTSEAWNGVKNTVGGAWESVKQNTANVCESVGGAVSGAFTNIGNWVCEKMGIAQEGSERAWNAMDSTASGISAGMVKAASTNFSDISKAVTNSCKASQSTAAASWIAMGLTLGKNAGSMAASVSKNFSGMSSTTKKNTSAVQSAVQSGFTKAKSSIVNNMGSAMSTLKAQDWYSVGSNICAGIGNGINAGWSWLRNTVGNLASNLLNAAESALGIHSPSVLFKKLIGLNIGYGIGEGIEASEPAILKTVTGVADSIADGFRAQEYAIEPISVDKASGLPRALDGFSDTITDSFTALLDRLEAIAQRVTFTMPAVAGTVMPYQVSSPGSGKSKTAETIEASNEELGSIIIQVVNQAVAAIVRAIEENGGGDNPIDRAGLLRAVKEDLNKETKMRGRTPLPV